MNIVQNKNYPVHHYPESHYFQFSVFPQFVNLFTAEVITFIFSNCKHKFWEPQFRAILKNSAFLQVGVCKLILVFPFQSVNTS